MTRENATGSWVVTDRVRNIAELPEHLHGVLDRVIRESEGSPGGGIVIGAASEIIEAGESVLPEWAGDRTFYLVYADVPEPALMRLPTILRLHKPDRRLHVTRDRCFLRRLTVARIRDVPWEGIVDAYLLGGSIVALLGDLSIRGFPHARIPALTERTPAEIESFSVDPDGSFLHWPSLDIHLGASELLQAVDPMYLAEVEVERYGKENTATALREMREERGLRQSDIPGVSARHVRRLEQEASRLTPDAARSYADALDLPLEGFLRELGARLRGISDEIEQGKRSAGSAFQPSG